MIVSSVFFWLEQIRYKAEAYECNTLEQRRLWKAESPVPEETRWSCPLGFEGESARWEHEDDCVGPDLPDPPDNGDKAEVDPVTPVQCLEVEVMKEATLSPMMRAKGKSLDSLLVTIREEKDVTEKVEMRRKRHTVGGVLPELVERRKGVFWGLETIDEDCRLSGPYENIWECGSLPLKIHHGDISRTSVTFEETVEEFETSNNVPIKYFANISEDMVQWLTDLIDSYSGEEDLEMESYTPLPVRVYAPEINRNVPPANRMTVGFIPSSRTNLEPKTFEKCTKISVDGKSTKIGKSETLKLEDNQLMISDEKGNYKVLVSDFGKFQEQPPKSTKELLYTHVKSVVKMYIENTDVIEKKTILQRLLGMRTPYSTLESRGIAKNEAVFGNTLENISLREKKNVPEFVTKITRLIEMPKNITSQGIYRASGNIATIQKIRWKVDLHKLNILDDHKDDTDVLAGTLKLFFRELKDCIIGIEQYNALNDILGGKVSAHRRKGLTRKPLADKSGANGDLYMAVIDVIKTLSKPRRETMEHLMRHLLRVISYEKENSMSIQNMSICWGPSIICLEVGSTKDDIIALAQKKNSIVELLLRSYKHLFESQLRPSGSQLSLLDHHPSLRRLDSYEEIMPSKMRWSSMTALDNCLGEDFVIDIMRRIEMHKDANSAYKRMEGDKVAARIIRKAKQKTSKTLNRLLVKAKIEELCILLKFCYDDHFVSLLPQGKCSDLQKMRDNLKESFKDHEIAAEMYKEIRPLMRKQPLFKQHVPLFAHFHKLMDSCGDPVTKLHEISIFWYKTICGTESKGHDNILIIFDVIEAFTETDWIDLPEIEDEEDIKGDTMRHSKTVGSALSNISEENLFDEKAEKRSKCEDVIDCCTTKRPVTFTYTKASESDQD